MEVHAQKCSELAHTKSPVNRNPNSLNSILVLPNRHAEDKLDGAPQAVKLRTLVHIHHTVGRRSTLPHWLIQESLDTRQQDFKHGQATAQTFPCQQVSLCCNVCLLR